MLERTLGENIVRSKLSADPVVVIADWHQLEQIMVNLALNAPDAMPDGVVLTSAAEPSGDDSARDAERLLLRGLDTGHGMPPDVLARAFEPLFTTKPRGQGTGHRTGDCVWDRSRSNGEVMIESTVGAATTVLVRLPIAERAAEDRTAFVERMPGGHERILLVQDETPLRVGTARLLVENGCEVLVAADGVEALDVIDREHATIDLVIGDVAMSRMRSDEFARLRAEPDPAVPVIFMTGYDSCADTLTGRLLPEPVAESILLRSMREVFGV
jgi:CheY-like chemotaxis protein